MNAQIAVIVVSDRSGGIAVATAQTPDTLIHLRNLTGGGLTGGGQPVDYLGRAGDVADGAAQHGLKYEEHTLDLDLAAKKVKDWNYRCV
jgi:hypothetical protein